MQASRIATYSMARTHLYIWLRSWLGFFLLGGSCIFFLVLSFSHLHFSVYDTSGSEQPFGSSCRVCFHRKAMQTDVNRLLHHCPRTSIFTHLTTFFDITAVGEATVYFMCTHAVRGLPRTAAAHPHTRLDLLSWCPILPFFSDIYSGEKKIVTSGIAHKPLVSSCFVCGAVFVTNERILVSLLVCNTHCEGAEYRRK